MAKELGRAGTGVAEDWDGKGDGQRLRREKRLLVLRELSWR